VDGTCLFLVLCRFDAADSNIIPGASCPAMDGMTSAGLVAMPSTHRRESFLYRSSGSQLLAKSTGSATNEQYVFHVAMRT